MEKELINWNNNVLSSMDDALSRIETHSLNSKNQAIILEVIGDLINKLSEESSYQAIAEEYLNIQSALEEKDIDKIDIGSIREWKQQIENKLADYEKFNYIADAMQLDAQGIMPLMEQIKQKQDEVRQSFQKALDLDMKVHGQASEITLQAISAFHFDIDKDMQIVIQKSDDKNMDSKSERLPKEADIPTTKESEKQPENNKSEFKRISLKLPQIEADELRELENQLFKAGARYEKYTIPAEKSFSGQEINGKSWFIWQGADTDMSIFEPYIKSVPDKNKTLQNNQEKTNTDSKPAEAEGKEYLYISPRGKEQFQDTIMYLKENGAAFDPVIKAWFITKECDREKFKAFLGNERKSVIGKLNENKNSLKVKDSEMENNSADKQREEAVR